MFDTKLVTETQVIQRKKSHIEPGITHHIMKYYGQRTVETKSKIDQHAAEISQRQDKMRLLNELMAEINNLTTDQNELDIRNHPDIQEKIDVLRKLGIKIPENKWQFNAVELIRLNENLQLGADNWDKENKSQTQKLERVAQHLGQLMILMKDALRCTRTTWKTIERGISR